MDINIASTDTMTDIKTFVVVESRGGSVLRWIKACDMSFLH